MLVLTRKLLENLVIDENIIIKVLSVKGNQVRLGIIAPTEVRILREELCARRIEKNLTITTNNIKVNHPNNQSKSQQGSSTYESPFTDIKIPF